MFGWGRDFNAITTSDSLDFIWSMLYVSIIVHSADLCTRLYGNLFLILLQLDYQFNITQIIILNRKALNASPISKPISI